MDIHMEKDKNDFFSYIRSQNIFPMDQIFKSRVRKGTTYVFSWEENLGHIFI